MSTVAINDLLACTRRWHPADAGWFAEHLDQPNMDGRVFVPDTVLYQRHPHLPGLLQLLSFLNKTAWDEESVSNEIVRNNLQWWEHPLWLKSTDESLYAVRRVVHFIYREKDDTVVLGVRTHTPTPAKQLVGETTPCALEPNMVCVLAANSYTLTVSIDELDRVFPEWRIRYMLAKSFDYDAAAMADFICAPTTLVPPTTLAEVTFD